jgi:hypothetical protein
MVDALDIRSGDAQALVSVPAGLAYSAMSSAFFLK